MTYETIISNFKRTPLSDEEIEILQKNGYRFNSYTPDRIKGNIEMILYMLEKDPSCVDLYDSTIIKGIKNAGTYNLYKLFKFLDENYIPYEHLQYAPQYNIAKNYSKVEDVFSCLVICRNIKNCNIRTTNFDSIRQMSNLAWYWEYALWEDEEREIVIRALTFNKIPASVLPNIVLTDPDVIKAYTANLSSFKQENVLRALTSTQYDPELEDDFCTPYACQTIEEYLNKKVRSYTPREPSDIEQLAAIKIYVHKLLDRHNVPNRVVCLNSFNDNPNVHCFTNGNDINLTLYPTRTYDEMALAGAHEAFHEVQDYLIETLQIDKDPDIDTYAKDIFLRLYYLSTGEMDYYDENYSSITAEFDAEYRANIEMYNIENPISTEEQFETLKIDIEQRKEAEEEILEGLSADTAYTYTRTRYNEHGERVYLDDLVEEKLRLTIENEGFDVVYSSIMKKLPILAYEFHIAEDDVHKKSASELLNDLISAKDERTRLVYIELISSYMTETKHKNYMDNVIFFQGVVNDPNVPEDIREAILVKLDESMENKYLNLVNVNLDLE